MEDQYDLLKEKNKKLVYLKNKEIEEQLKNEGSYLIGLILKIYEMVKDNLKLKNRELSMNDKTLSEKEREKIQQEINSLKLKKVNKDKELMNNPSLDTLGEYIDQIAEGIEDDLTKIDDEITNVELHPEKIFNRRSTFLDLLRESKNYNKQKNFVTPKAILTMVHILDRRKINLIQWRRVATFCEIIYKYLNKGETREQFFSSTNQLNEVMLNELEEFWKNRFYI